MSDNSAVIKIIARHTKEYNVLLSEYNVLMKVHVKTVNDFADKCLTNDSLKDTIKTLTGTIKILNGQKKDLIAIVVRFERENKSLQQSIEDAQQELERANEVQKTDRLVETDEYGYTDEEKYGPQEGEGG